MFLFILSCSHLEDLALVKCFEITDNGLNTLFENLQDLESLVIDYLNTQLTVKMFANVPVKVLKKIRYINIHNHMGYIEVVIPSSLHFLFKNHLIKCKFFTSQTILRPYSRIFV